METDDRKLAAQTKRGPGRPPGWRWTERFTSRMSKGQMAKLKDMAAERHVTVAQQIRSWIDDDGGLAAQTKRGPARPPGLRWTERLTSRMSKEQMTKLKGIATERKVTIAQQIRDWIDDA